MPSTYLTRTFGSPTNRKKFTLSMWVKLSGRGSGNNNALLVCGTAGGDEATISFGNDALTWTEYKPSGTVGYLATNRQFRDYNSWYHLVFSWDTTLSTADDRMKIYVNGVQETSFSGRTNPSQNYDAYLNTNIVHEIGRQTWNSSGRFNGSMSHIHFCDGYTYQASDFGSTDSTTGEWKINTSPSVTYGNNGFFILKDGNSVTDQSGNGNNFTVSAGTLTNTEDCPSNVFATLNPLAGTAIGSYTNGNNRVVGVATSWTTAPSTLAVSSGKFYCEAKAQHTSLMVGILDIDQMVTNNFQGTKSNGWGYEVTGTLWNNGSGTTSWGSTYTTGDIIGIAMDLDNNKLYFSKNGTWQNSADPSAGTGGISITADKTYYFAMSPVDSTSSVIETNFGNGYFGTTAVASAGTNASGIGIFEYDVPTGYTALSTKGLNL